MDGRPFAVDVPQAALDDLRERLARTRWPDEIEDAGWDYGTNLPYLRDVAAYWRTRSYYERAREPRRITSRITVPTGVALSTEAVQRVPRERAERSYADIRRWTEFSRGGHFLAAEEPLLLAEELRAFFRPFRQTR